MPKAAPTMASSLNNAEASLPTPTHHAEKVIALDPGINEKVAALVETAHIENADKLFDSAAAATAEEQNMGVMQAIRAYPRAVFFSMLFSTAIIMEGFDLTMINAFYGLPAFQKQFGQPSPDGGFLITPAW